MILTAAVLAEVFQKDLLCRFDKQARQLSKKQLYLKYFNERILRFVVECNNRPLVLWFSHVVVLMSEAIADGVTNCLARTMRQTKEFPVQIVCFRSCGS